MNYNALIENRKSVREFRDAEISDAAVSDIKSYYEKNCKRLIPELKTLLLVLDSRAQKALEGAAGYQEFLIGAPHYLILMSEKQPHAPENAGYMMEDLVLKLTDMGLDSCWITFTDSDKIKTALSIESPLEIAAIVAFGFGEKTAKKMRVNILSMSNVDISAQRQYYSHKKNINDLVSLRKWGNTEGLEEVMGFYDDMLWQSFYAAAQAPSYLNRQPYGFLLLDHELVLVSTPDAYTGAESAGLNLGVVMLHFAAVAEQWVGQIRWDLDARDTVAELPEGYHVAAVYHM